LVVRPPGRLRGVEASQSQRTLEAAIETSIEEAEAALA
jgi:hypothetical protein